MPDFSDQYRKIIMRYKRIGYNLNVMREFACLVINPMTVDGFAAGNLENKDSSYEFEFQLDPTSDCGVSCP